MRSLTTTAIATLIATAGTASAQSSWTNSAGGSWSNAANWDTVSAPLVAGDSAILPNLGPNYDVTCDANPAIDALSINGPTQRLLIPNNRTLTIGTNAGLINEGTVIINETGSVFDVALTFDTGGSVSLAGAGVTEINGPGNPNDARLNVATGTTLFIRQPVRGAGIIDVDGLVTNESAVTANVSGSDLRITGLFGQIPTASLQGTGGGLVGLDGAVISGGQFLGGVEVSGAGTTLGLLTMSGDNGVRQSITASINSTVTNNGTFTVNIAGSVFDAILQTGPMPTTVNGTGTIDLNGAGSPGDAQLVASAGSPLTIESAQTVSGDGTVDATAAGMTFRGIALADSAGRDLTMTGDFDFDGTGRTQSSGGIVLFNNASVGLALIQGDTDTSGMSTITNCVNTGTLRVRQNSSLIIDEGLTNNSSFVLNPSASTFDSVVNILDDASIDGTGTITMIANSAIGDAQINVDAAATLDIESGQTVSGSGTITADGLINMSGAYNGTSASFDLRLEGNHDLTFGGSAEGTGGGAAVFRNADVTGGSMLGGVDVEGSTTMRGFNNTGAFGIRNNSDLFVDADIANNGTITVNTTASVFDSRVIATTPITINGTGTIVLDGASTAADAQLSANQNVGGSIDLPTTQTVTGRGRIDGPMNIRGMLAVGADDLNEGVIQIKDDVTLHSTSTVQLDFNSLTVFDHITDTGAPTLNVDGTIELRLQGGYQPNVGDSFVIINVDTMNGEFPTTVTPLIGTRLFRVIESGGGATALWTCLGDTNLDGLLTPADFTAWIAAFNTGDLEVGDQNLDGILSPGDFTAWIANFNAGC